MRRKITKRVEETTGRGRFHVRGIIEMQGTRIDQQVTSVEAPKRFIHPRRGVQDLKTSPRNRWFKMQRPLAIAS